MNDFQIPQFQWGSLSSLSALAGRIGTQKLTELMESLSLTRHHFTIACAVAEFGAMSQNDLAKRSNLNPGHLVSYIDELSSRGIVERSVDPQDRRRNIITLTQAGEKFTAAAKEATTESEAEAFGALDANQQEQLRTLLQLVASRGGAQRV